MSTLPKIRSVNVRLATEDDKQQHEAFDNTKLQAINTCPTWGIVRYGHHLRMPGAGRSMPLEAGAAAHEVFAAVRLIDMAKYQGLNDHFMFHGVQLFGEERFEAMREWLFKSDDDRTRHMNFALEALYTSGFHDDPMDKRRTMTNIEEAMIAYMDRWPWGKHPVWTEDENDPQSMIGVENEFDIVLEYHLDDGNMRCWRFTGKIDGIHLHSDTHTIHENKTASRLDDAWRESFLMSSQVTGYCLATSLLIQQAVSNACIVGVALPQPRSYDYGGIVFEHVSRASHMTQDWFRWFLHTVLIYEEFVSDPKGAPRYTHSCNRYFRPCAMIPFCASEPEEQDNILSEMEHDEWSPLSNEKAGEQM
jgi:hypothetical protein